MFSFRIHIKPLDGNKAQTMSCHRPYIGWGGGSEEGERTLCLGFASRKNTGAKL